MPSSTRKRVALEREQTQRRTRILLAVIGVVVVGALIAAVVLAQGDSDSPKAADPSAQQTQPVTVTGTPLPTFATGADDGALGTAIPELDGKSFDGSAVTITDNGKPKVIVFAAHWCPHCQKELPLIAESIAATPLPAGVDMTVVSTGVNAQAPNYPPSDWFKSLDWPTPVLADDASNSAAQAYGLSSYPFFVFVDKDNNVVSRYAGEMPIDEFRAQVDALAT